MFRDADRVRRRHDGDGPSGCPVDPAIVPADLREALGALCEPHEQDVPQEPRIQREASDEVKLFFLFFLFGKFKLDLIYVTMNNMEF